MKGYYSKRSSNGLPAKTGDWTTAQKGEAKAVASWDVFFSYSRKDSEIVQRCVDACAREGIRVWLDVNPRPPKLTRRPIFITHGILESHLLCLFGSRNALSSRWVKEEFGTFAKRALGFWDDRLEPIAVVARLPDFDLESSVFVEPEWCASANEHFAAVDVSIAKDDPKPLVEKLQHILGLVRKSLDGKDEAHDRLGGALLPRGVANAPPGLGLREHHL